MKWMGFLFVLLMSTAMTRAGQGKVVSEGLVISKNFGANRMVRVYLPPSYEREPERRFPVLYLHDGQNTFTTVGTNVAFGWGNWELDKTVNALCADRKMREIIMVAIDCDAERYLDYRGPAYPYAESELKEMKRPPPAPGDNSRYEKYARFLIEELKPKIDREYRTLSGAMDTGVMGSSMGGLCSLVLAWDHPEVFGKAASLSGSFQVERTNFLSNVLRAYRGKPKPIRVYLDSGTMDYTGGDDGRKHTDAAAVELTRIGWKEGGDLEHFVDLKPLTEPELEKAGLRQDKWKEAQTSQHNEFYWRLRAWRPLVFFFPPR
jgi:predicted alpha/beta superfamily hydrolase